MQNFSHSSWRIAYLSGLCFSILCCFPLGQAAQDIQQAKVAEIIEGNQVFVEQQRVQVNAIAKRGQKITTQSARAEIEFDNGAIARMGNNSRLLVGGCNKLEQGNVLVSGRIPLCTQNITAAVRGTTFYVEISDDGSENLSVLEGEVEVTDVNDSQAKPLIIKAGQKLKALRNARLSQRLSQLSQSEYEDIVRRKLLVGFRRRLAKTGMVQQSLRRLYPRSRLILHLQNPIKR